MGLGFEVLGLGFEVLVLGFEVLGLGVEVLGLGFQVLGLGFKVSGLRCEVLGLELLLGFTVSLQDLGQNPGPKPRTPTRITPRDPSGETCLGYEVLEGPGWKSGQGSRFENQGSRIWPGGRRRCPAGGG